MTEDELEQLLVLKGQVEKQLKALKAEWNSNLADVEDGLEDASVEGLIKKWGVANGAK